MSVIHRLRDYIEIVGQDIVSEICKKAKKLSKRHIVHINSTYQGGGVAEMLASLVPLMNDVQVDTGWRILRGSTDFFTTTQKFHNALQGENINFSQFKKRLYINTNKDFSVYTHISHDCVIVHDPQPLPLIKFYKKRQPWVWRCHLDLSNPDSEVWEYLKKFILEYDLVVISNEKYKRKDLPLEQRVIYPAIDPLSLKNMELSEGVISKYLKKFKIPIDKPLIVQISRFDKWKDIPGVVEVFKLVKKEIDCRLVLCGNIPADDPGGNIIREKVMRKERRLIDNLDIIVITCSNDVLVNALQRSASVIIQKSIREGFGLTVTEALWKEKPVVASGVGGIPLQIKDGENGFLVEPNDINGCAGRVAQILKNPNLGEELGKKGKQTVKNNFLITRLLSDYLELLNDILN